jgi:hypothetical protein
MSFQPIIPTLKHGTCVKPSVELTQPANPRDSTRASDVVLPLVVARQRENPVKLWMEEILLHQLVDGLSHYNPIIFSVSDLQEVTNWYRILSIQSISYYSWL